MKPLDWSWRTKESSKNFFGSASLALGFRLASSSKTALSPVGMHGGNDGLHAADLHDGDVFFGHESEMAQGDARAGVDRGAETGDAQGLAPQLFAFGVRIGAGLRTWMALFQEPGQIRRVPEPRRTALCRFLFR